jgi:hypothetical protein
MQRVAGNQREINLRAIRKPFRLKTDSGGVKSKAAPFALSIKAPLTLRSWNIVFNLTVAALSSTCRLVLECVQGRHWQFHVLVSQQLSSYHTTRWLVWNSVC